MAVNRAVRTTFLKRVDHSTSPWQMDLQLDPFEVIITNTIPTTNATTKPQDIQASRLMKGIYTLNDKELVYCMAAPGKPRPKTFETPKGSEQTLIRLERFTTGEEEVEKALKAAKVSHFKDQVGWIVSVTLRKVDANQLLPKVAQLKKLRTLYHSRERSE